MPSLIVHHVDEAVVRALQERAAQHGRSVEAEHRILLAEVLLRPRRRALAEVLAEMPDVGLDRDFERPSSAGAAMPSLKALLLSDEARAELPLPPRGIAPRRVPPAFE